MGAYYTSGVTYHTFNLSNGQEIVLWDEIDSTRMNEFNRYLAKKVDPILTENRKRFPDSEWASALSTWMEDNESGIVRDSVGAFFHLNDIREDSYFIPIREGTNYYIDSACVNIDIGPYFDLPHVIQNMEVFGDVAIPFADLKKFLKKNSILQRL